MPVPSQVTITHFDNVDVASAVIAAASASQRVYVIGLMYTNGTAGALNPKMVSNAKTMWFGSSVGAGGSNYFLLSSEGVPISDGVNQAVTFGAAASAASWLTVWWFYGP